MSMECVCDSYSWPYSAALRTARKEHGCYECGRKIQPGERYEYVWGVCEGEAFVSKTCPRCLALREWVTAHVPCFCWAHGHIIEDAENTVEEYAHEAPGLRFGLLRHKVLIGRGPARVKTHDPKFSNPPTYPCS